MVFAIYLTSLSCFSMSGLDVMRLVQKESQKKQTRFAVITMKIFDKDGRERRRFFNYWTKSSPENEKSLIKFFRPKNVKGTALFTESKVKEGPKVQWIYLPAFKSVRQLSSSDSNKSFMGSDFTYSDIAGRKLSQDNHKLVKEEGNYYFIESTPVDPKKAIYSRILYVVHKKFNIISKAIFFDRKGVRLKSLVSTKVSTINGVYVVMLSEMENHITGGKTFLNVESMTIGEPIKNDLMSIKGLKSL